MVAGKFVMNFCAAQACGEDKRRRTCARRTDKYSVELYWVARGQSECGRGSNDVSTKITH